MTQNTLSLEAPPIGKDQSSTIKKSAIWLLTLEALLLFIPLIVLGRAINWPASLDEPASVNLPLILEQFPAMFTGYSVYLIYSLLFWPMALVAGRAIFESSDNFMLQIANGVAVLSAFARALGIVRWLFAMPVLATIYVDPGSSAELKESISVVYEMLNAYAGGIGEILGVNFFAAIWLTIMSIVMLRSARWPKWLPALGMVAAISLFINVINVVGIDTGFNITLSVTLFHFWMLGTAIILYRE
ncbi:MAG: DUF4386 family protein [Chloroflexota bacterium]